MHYAVHVGLLVTDLYLVQDAILYILVQDAIYHYHSEFRKQYQITAVATGSNIKLQTEQMHRAVGG